MVIVSRFASRRNGGNRTRLMDCSNNFIEAFPQDAIFILGAGRFGTRAARVLSSSLRSPIWLIDKDENAVCRTDLPLLRIRMDVFDFLQRNHSSLRPEHILVPSIPVHVAFEWLRRSLGEAVIREHVPGPLISGLPNTWPGSEGSLLVSYADFQCPEDCPEPADHCTATGRERRTPLYKLLREIDIADHHVRIVRSQQLAPGVGGYRFGDLMRLLDGVKRSPRGKWLLGTACRCHGIITAFTYRGPGREAAEQMERGFDLPLNGSDKSRSRTSDHARDDLIPQAADQLKTEESDDG